MGILLIQGSGLARANIVGFMPVVVDLAIAKVDWHKKHQPKFDNRNFSW